MVVITIVRWSYKPTLTRGPHIVETCLRGQPRLSDMEYVGICWRCMKSEDAAKVIRRAAHPRCIQNSQWNIEGSPYLLAIILII
jgi:hypothetical protein